MEGWIKLHRKIKDWEWYKHSETMCLFIHLLLSANHEDKKWKGIIIKRGELVTGRFSLSKDTGITERSIRTCIKRLKSTNEIAVKTTNKYSIITICKYEDYQYNEIESDQQNDQQTDQQLTSKRPTTDHKQEYKELKNIKKKEIGSNSNSEIKLPFNGEFKTTWESWVNYRKEIKKPLKSETSMKEQLDMLAEHTETEAIEIIKKSIRNQWQGLFPIKDKSKTKKPTWHENNKYEQYDNKI